MMIEVINKKKKTYAEELYIADESTARSKAEEMDKKYKKFIEMFCKCHINENRSRLQKISLSKDEQFTLKYLNFNPRIALIFDDCTEQIKRNKSHPIIQKLFYQGRHSFVTTIIACHTDKALDAELKKNAFVSIYTEETCAHACFERKSSDLDKEARARATAACKASFTPLNKHIKLAWVREEKKFYKLCATRREDFQFGSPYIWEYCKQIQAEVGSISIDNRFMQDFMY
jgi:adenylylsulfate kinase-like enzyme